MKSRWRRLLNKHKVIGFLGVSGSGKDFSANKYVFESNFKRISFADPIRLLISMVFGGDVVYEKYNKFKNTNIMLGFFWRTITGREFLQKIGHGIRLIFGDSIYLEVMDKKIESLVPEIPGVVIPDVRYLNEAQYVLDLGGELIFCNYESDRYDCFSTHASEELAQALIALGFKDGEKITLDDLKTAVKIIEESKKLKIEEVNK